MRPGQFAARGRTLDESREVGRAHHVEVDVEPNAAAFLLGQGPDMVARADEAALLGAPEREPQALSGWAGQLQRRFEDRG